MATSLINQINYNNNFTKAIFFHFGTIHRKDKVATKTEITFTEKEEYIKRVAFFLSNFIKLCNQLEISVELLGSFNYKKLNRGAQLTYNLENYFIRLSSISDRLLQLVNAVHDFGLEPSKVDSKSVKEKFSTPPKYIKQIKKFVSKHAKDRDAIIHRYSIYDKKLHNLNLFFDDDFSAFQLRNDTLEEAQAWKQYRKEILSEYLKDKKKELRAINKELFEIILDVFSELEKQIPDLQSL